MTVILVLACTAGGVGWAATRAAAPGVISACANDSNQLFLSTNGSCAAGQTLVQWNQQGPPGLDGPPGQQGPPGTTSAPNVLGFAQHRYSLGFTITATLSTPGSYVLGGSVYARLSGFPGGQLITVDDHTSRCELLTGPPNGTATRVASWSFTFHHLSNPSRWSPPSLTAPVDVSSGLDLPRNRTPVEIYFSCSTGGGSGTWTDPMIDTEMATVATFHPTVGPALPLRRTIGPGPLKKVLGAALQ